MYGHPDAGGYWEQHCRTIVLKAGFTELSNWPNVYFHKGRQLLLVVYVDDFKLAGPVGELAWGWEQLRKDINMDEPAPALDSKLSREPGFAAESEVRTHRYLGCNHDMQTISASSGLAKKLLAETAHVRIAPPDEAMSEDDNKPRAAPKPPVNGVLNVVRNNMADALQGACDKYLAVAPAGTKLRASKTPFIDEALLPDGQEVGDI